MRPPGKSIYANLIETFFIFYFVSDIKTDKNEFLISGCSFRVSVCTVRVFPRGLIHGKELGETFDHIIRFDG